MGIRQRIGEIISGSAAQGRQLVSEIIGRVSYVVTGSAISKWKRADDRTQANYEWYDNLRRGKLDTYKLGALFVKPMIEHITSWALGGGFKALTESEPTNEALADFVDDHLYDLIVFVQEGMGLGDAYLIVNADGTLSAVPASQVEIETDKLDYRRVLAYTITSVQEGGTIIDRYALEGRTITIKRTNMADEVLTFPLVAGRLPVVHLPYLRSTNEVYGHPFHEALVPLFAEYDDVLTNSLMGVKTMSNPIPTIEDALDPQTELDRLATGTETYIDSSGVTRTENVIDRNALEIVATSGKFSYKGPGSFTADAWQMLKALFYLMLQHSNIPEWVWGGAIASSMASVQAQMPAWVKFIEGQRMLFEKAIRELLEIWLATVSLYTPGVQSGLKLSIEWPEVAPADQAMRLAYIARAGDRGIITDQTELELLDLVKDAAAEVAAAKAEGQARQAEQDRMGDAWDMALDEAQRNLSQQQNQEAA
jgi:hypothetical protein